MTELFGQNLEDIYKNMENIKGDEEIRHSANTVETTLYKGYDIELNYPCAIPGLVSQYSLKDHRQRLKQDGWIRLAYPSEVFSLVIKQIKEKLIFDNDIRLANSFKSANKEFLCILIQKSDTQIKVYKDSLDEGMENDTSNLFFITNIGRFDIGGIDNGINYIKDIPEHPLIELLYSRQYNDLPDEIKDLNPYIEIPINKGLWPVVLDYPNLVLLNEKDEMLPSRGVRSI